MEKHPITDVATVCQWFIDRCGYRKQDKWVLPMFDVCYPFPPTLIEVKMDGFISA
jgi:hypothetical protein